MDIIKLRGCANLYSHQQHTKIFMHLSDNLLPDFMTVTEQIGGKVLVAQSCLTLCNPTNCSPLDSSVHGIIQARILEWVTIPFSGGSS